MAVATTTDKSAFWQGARAGAPFVLVVAPFALLFGVVGTEAGLSLDQVMGFSVLVIAGASQFTALQLMVEDAPTLIVLATALAVNMRMAMYSAALAPLMGALPLRQRILVAYGLVDQTYAVAAARFETEPQMPLARRFGFFMGSFWIVAPVWYAMALAGALVGTAIPPEFALDFAVPITFLALIAPALRTLPHVLAALTSTLLALALVWVPYGLGLILAAMAAMAVGALSEQWLARRA
jgi:predicted branched-subunit amino acid permease